MARKREDCNITKKKIEKMTNYAYYTIPKEPDGRARLSTNKRKRHRCYFSCAEYFIVIN